MTQTLQLPEDIRKAIEQEAENLYPYVWPKNKEGEDFTPRPGQGAPFSNKVKKLQAAYIAGATARALACIQKDEEIARLKDELNNIKSRTYTHAEVNKMLLSISSKCDEEIARLRNKLGEIADVHDGTPYDQAVEMKSIATEALKQ